MDEGLSCRSREERETGSWAYSKASPFHTLSRQCIKLRLKPNTAECSPGVLSATAESQPRESRVSESDSLVLTAALSGLRAELQPKRDKG